MALATLVSVLGCSTPPSHASDENVRTGQAEIRGNPPSAASWNWYHGQTPEQVATLLSARGARLVSLQAESTSPLLLTVAMVQNVGSGAKKSWWSVALSESRLRTFIDEVNGPGGARIVDIDAYVANGSPLFNVVLEAREEGEGSWWWYPRESRDGLAALLRDHDARLVRLHQYELDGSAWFAAVMVASDGDGSHGSWWYDGISAEEVSAHLSEHDAVLTYLEPANVSGSAFNAIMDRRGPNACSWWYTGYTDTEVSNAASSLVARATEVRSYSVNGAQLFATLLVSDASLGCSNVLTRSNNNQRTAANLSETTLNQGNVKAGSFGKVFTLPVDAPVYGQVLYASSVPLRGGVANVAYVATTNNSVYAFDGDSGRLIWQENFNNGFVPPTDLQVGGGLEGRPVCGCVGCYQDFSATTTANGSAGSVGIVGTPVIDGATFTMYFVAQTVESGVFKTRLWAIDIRNGTSRPNSPLVLDGTNVKGQGSGGGSDAGTLAFAPEYHVQRPGLALSNGVVYIGFAGYCDSGPYHGWLIGVDAASMTVVGAFDATPNGNDAGSGIPGGAGIWHGGNAPAIAEFGPTEGVYVATGNGTFDTAGDWGNSVLRLGPRSLVVADHFTAPDWSERNANDLDLGAAGPLLWGRVVIQGGKEGIAYVLDQERLGGSDGFTSKQAFQAVNPSAQNDITNGEVLWRSPQGTNAYFWGEGDVVRAYRYDSATGQFGFPSTLLGATSAMPKSQPGGTLALSANGSTPGTGVLWGMIPASIAAPAGDAAVPGGDAATGLDGGTLDAAAQDACASGLDLSGLPIPDLPIGDSGATTTNCLACMTSQCSAAIAACGADCTCTASFGAFFECVASGQPVLQCALATGDLSNAPYTALRGCVRSSCADECDLASGAGGPSTPPRPGVLYAFNAENLGEPLWQSSAPATPPGPDDIGAFAKFNPPTIANGKVYVPSFSGYVSVFGLLNNRSKGTACQSNGQCASNHCEAQTGTCQSAH